MVSVVIVGILATIAIPSFRSYLNRSKVQEAYGFLAQIRARQESYMSEFGEYCDVSQGSLEDFTPSSTPGSKYVQWPAVPGNWTQLGARPDGPVRFTYSTIAEVPGGTNTPPAGTGVEVNDFWYVSWAAADLDDDGTRMVIESYSDSGQMPIIEPSDGDEAKGWE